MMIRLTSSIILPIFLLVSCDKLPKTGATPGSGKTVAEQVQISSPSKPEIVAAFEAIALATHEHNRVLLENINGKGPVNGPAYAAGILHLDRSARKQGGLGKQIIEAIAMTHSYEQGLFVPFDTMRRQVEGMETWTSSQALQRRGYIQIIDQQMATYDQAISYLERGEEPLLRQNFKKSGVPLDVSEEFLRVRRIWTKESGPNQLGMFCSQRASMESFRAALATNDPAKASALWAEGEKHEQEAKAFEGKMIAELRKNLSASGLL